MDASPYPTFSTSSKRSKSISLTAGSSMPLILVRLSRKFPNDKSRWRSPYSPIWTLQRRAFSTQKGNQSNLGFWHAGYPATTLSRRVGNTYRLPALGYSIQYRPTVVADLIWAIRQMLQFYYRVDFFKTANRTSFVRSP